MIAPRAPRLRVLDCEVDATRRIVTRADGAGAMRLTVKATQVLLALAAQRGAVVSREALFERVWPDTMPTDDVLTQAVTQLRKAFGDDRDAPRYIETIAKGGYRLLAEVEWLDAEAPAAEAPAIGATADGVAGPPSADAAASPAAGAVGRRRRRRPLLAAGAWLLALVVLLGVAAILAWPRLRSAPAAGAVPVAVPVAGPAVAPPAYAVRYRAITSAPGQEQQPNLSPDGATVAFEQDDGSGRGSAIMLQSEGQAAARALTRPPAGASDRMPVWSRDGTRLAFVRVQPGRCELMVVPVNDGEPRRAGACFRDGYSQFDWTPDGRGLVMGALRDPDEASAPLRVLDLASGQWRPLRYGIAAGDVDLIPRYSPDGRWLAFRRNTSLADLWLMPADGGTPRRLTTLRGDIRGWDWLPDGSGLVLSHVTTEGSLYVYRIADGAIHALPPLSQGNAVNPDVAAKAWKMVFEIDQSRSGVFRLRPDDGTREPVFASSGVDMLPAISPDGRSLAFVSDRTMAVQLWIGEVGQPATLHAIDGLTPVPRHPPAWSADGRTLLVIGKTVAGDRLFEVDAGSGSVRRLEVPDAGPAFAAYTGDPARRLVGVDGGQGRLRLVLYELPGWRRLASLDDVAVARHDARHRHVYFTRPSKPGLWRADEGLQAVEQVADDVPPPPHYRHWALVDGTPYYAGPASGCDATWRPLAAARDADAPCLSHDGVIVAGSPSVDADGGWIYAGLPLVQNIDIGWAALPRATDAAQ